MLPLVEIRALVRPYAPWLASVCSPEAFVPFQRDVRTLIVSEHKTVDGIHRLCVLDVRHHSSLHRLVTESPSILERDSPDSWLKWTRMAGEQTEIPERRTMG